MGPPPRPTYAPPPLPPPDVLGEDEELIAGRRPVEEAFVARRPAHRLLVVPQRRQALEKLVLHATSLRLPIIELEGGTLTALAGFDGHQGVALVVEPRQFATLEDILARAAERNEAPFVLALDSLEDPQNVGTLLRSAEAAGVHGVLFPTHRQAPLTPSAVKASAGAVEHLLLAPVDDLARALTDLRGHGLRVAGAEATAPLTARQSDLRGPLVIVVGSEGQGLGPTVRRRADLFMRIPMRGAVGSLNAAVAGSILLFEAVAQRDPESRGAPPQPVAHVPDDADEPTPTPPEPTTTKPEPTWSKRAKATRRQAAAAARAAGEASADAAPAATVEADELLPADGQIAPERKGAAKPKAAAKSKAPAKPKAPAKAMAPTKSKAPASKAAAASKPRAVTASKAEAKPKPAAKVTSSPKSMAPAEMPTTPRKPKSAAAAKPTAAAAKTKLTAAAKRKSSAASAKPTAKPKPAATTDATVPVEPTRKRTATTKGKR
jgi:23S rRNA (guanosine2251-2'-O)-methyltransferase